MDNIQCSDVNSMCIINRNQKFWQFECKLLRVHTHLHRFNRTVYAKTMVGG